MLPSKTSVGDIELLEPIGEGTFATVHVGVDRSIGRRVAVKILKQERVDESASRFSCEAQIMGRLDHPNIVKIYSFGIEDDGEIQVHYIVSELVDGATLNDWQSFSSLQVGEIVDLFIRISEAVSYAHDNGIIHRDLKPDNVIVDLSGQPHITDFGLALQEGVRQTLSGTRVGTLAYMAPELIANCHTSANESSDVFSLGAMLYESLVGEIPASSVENRQQLAAIDVPPDLRILCERCIEPDPASRITTATFLMSELELIKNGCRIRSRRPGPVERLKSWGARNKRVSSFVALLLCTLPMLVLLCVFLYGQVNEAQKERANSLALAIAAAEPSELPSVIDDALGSPDRIRAAVANNLVAVLPNSDKTAKLHILFALHRLSQISNEELFAQVADSEANQCENFLWAASVKRMESERILNDIASNRMDTRHSLRAAILLLYLGDPSAVLKHHETSPDAVAHELQIWHAAPDKLLYLCDQLDDYTDLVFTICLSVGDTGQQESYSRFFEAVLAGTSDSGCRAAASFRLMRWGFRVPELEFVNVRGYSGHPFAICPLEYSGTKLTIGNQIPRVKVAFSEITEICNQLSSEAGLDPCYRLIDKSLPDEVSSYSIDLAADGFRLPLVSEWKFAANSGGKFPTVADGNFSKLSRFAVYMNNSDGKLAECGTKLPNRFGIFDVCGNVGEICHSDDLASLCWAGGHFLSPSEACSHQAIKSFEIERFPSIGFRLVRTILNNQASQMAPAAM